MTYPTESTWPKPVAAFQKFLGAVVLTGLWREHDHEAGGKLLQYDKGQRHG